MGMMPGALFLEPAYLDALRDSRSADADSGWLPQASPGPAPCWRKSHSWGEFVFDQAFAQAYERAGGRYYPKRVCALPYTPVPGPRLGTQPALAAAALRQQCTEGGESGAHVLFLPEAEAQAVLAEDPAWLPRLDLRFVWENSGYVDFDAFLAALPGKRRKRIRAERRQVGEHGLRIDWCHGGELDAAQWQRIYALYASTYAMRGQAPYLAPECLRAWGQAFGPRMPLCLARAQGEIVAMAFYFDDGDTLYGRHWGAAADFRQLHFELCYYQGIDYAIHRRRRRFDAGVQGGHRLKRGFRAEYSRSLHWFADPGLRAAVARYLEQERAQVQADYAALRARYG